MTPETSASEARKLKAQRRRAKVLRGGRDRLAYITGQKESPPTPTPPPEPTVKKHVEERQERDLSHHISSSTGKNSAEEKKETVPVVPTQVPAKPSDSRKQHVDQTETEEAYPQYQRSTSTTTTSTSTSSSWTASAASFRRLYPCLLALVYYVYVSTAFDVVRLLEESESSVATMASSSAVAWFVTYQVIALPLLGAEKLSAKSGSIVQLVLNKVFTSLRLHVALQVYDDLVLFLLVLLCLQQLKLYTRSYS